MKKKKIETEDLRLDPEKRLYPEFDELSIKQFPTINREIMGIPILDNCAEEHIQ